MTDDEKKEINKLKEKYQTEFLDDYELRFIFNVVKKQQEEIFKLQAKTDRLKVARENWKKTFYQAEEEIEKYKYLYSKALNNTIKADRDGLKKDKIIDLMAVHIKTTAIYECPSKDCEDDGSITCEDCIKEYFINKVEKENKDE